jgi:DNA-binding transcriptional MerR regulator
VHEVITSTGCYAIGQVARFAGVTIRTLHHYDEIGLLRPSRRAESGYRLYTDADLERLQRVLCYRELGFPLEEITGILDDPAVDPVDHLRRQHRVLTDRIAELERMVRAIEKTMEARKMGMNLTPQELFEVFGDVEIGGYQEEAEQRWGETDAWKESQRRTATYTKDDWLRIKAEADEIQRQFGETYQAGEPADGTAAMDLAERHRQHLERWFYPCGYKMHRNLGNLYVDDPRFAANYDKVAPGLERYVAAAIAANAERHGE